MSTFVTVDNLRAGIRDWTTRTHWSQDFHNQLYAELERCRRADPTLALWWDTAVMALGQWKALRSRVGGMSRAVMRERGLLRLPEIRRQYDGICAAHGGQAPDLAQVRWEELADLLVLARELKGAWSWMFASKLGHFLLPSCVIITGGQISPTNASYQDYWRSCQHAWLSYDTREPLIAELSAAMGVTPASGYPWSTKITELCYAGSRRLSLR